jgi:Family of unknown function (DUF6520)
MKGTRIVLVGAFVLAIGSAFVTKASIKHPENATFQQSVGVCSPLTTNCVAIGSAACDFHNIYKFQSSSSTCLTPLSQRN